MNRRRFLQQLLAGAAGAAIAATVDVDKLLWTAGEKTHVLPPPEGWIRADSGLLLQRGDVITIEGRFALHPQTWKELPFLQQFVVTEDATQNADGVSVLNIWPAIPDGTPFPRTRTVRPDRIERRDHKVWNPERPELGTGRIPAMPHIIPRRR